MTNNKIAIKVESAAVDNICDHAEVCNGIIYCFEMTNFTVINGELVGTELNTVYHFLEVKDAAKFIGIISDIPTAKYTMIRKHRNRVRDFIIAELLGANGSTV